MSPVFKKPAAKKKIVVKRTTSTTAKKTAAKPVAKRLAKPVAKRLAKPVAKPGVKPVVKPVQKAPAAAKPGLTMVAMRPGLEGRTNQDIINVIYKAADELRMPAWTLLAKVKLEHLVDARMAPYTGPAIGELPDLTPEQKAVIARTLLSYVPQKK